jgi:hypothetical protein
MTATNGPTAPMARADRAALIATAKSAATPVASCVAARISPAHILGTMTRAEVDALVIVLAEAADHALLRVVVEAVDDGHPGLTDADIRQQEAHAEAVRLRAAGQRVPDMVRILDAVYLQARKAERAAGAPLPDPEAERNRALLAQGLREHDQAVRGAA